MIARASIDPTALPPHGRRGWHGAVLAALAGAVAPMAALHVIQSWRDPLQQPVSFYVHGVGGWLLPLALGLFGAAAWFLSRVAPAGHRWCLALFAMGMLVAALVPCDPFFPWERPPTAHGLLHAGLATLAPLLLLRPMFACSCSPGGGSRFARVSVAAYVVGMLASATSLVWGLAHDGPPPFIGLAERVLAISAVGWLGAAALAARATR